MNQVSSMIFPCFLLILRWIFQKEVLAFLVTETEQRYTVRSSSRVPRRGAIHSVKHNSPRHQYSPKCSCRFSKLYQNDGDGFDTLETLEQLLSSLLSTDDSDARPRIESDHSHGRQLQRELLTTRLSNPENYDVESQHIHINLTYVEKSTVVDAGNGLFARKDCPKGTLLTCYPGDALVDLVADDNDVMEIDVGSGQGRVTWGSHATGQATTITHCEDDRDGDGNTNSINGSKFTLRQGYMLQAIYDDWGIVAIPELFGAKDSSYLGHFANDGARHPPRCEGELAAYMIESAEKANAMHQPCKDCHMVTVATRDVKAGEEIFVTYGPDYWREQSSFVSSSSSSRDTVDEYQYDDGFDVEKFDDSDFGYDYYDDEAESIVAEIIDSLEDQSESLTRGKGFG